MAIEFWGSYDDSNASKWDTVYLTDNGPAFALPGIAHVNVSQRANFDPAKGVSGNKGGSVIFKSLEPRNVIITLDVRDKASHDVLTAVLSRLSMASAKDIPALSIDHPMTRMWGIKKVYIETIQTPPPDREDGVQVTIECIEWFPAKPIAQNKPGNGSRSIIDSVAVGGNTVDAP